MDRWMNGWMKGHAGSWINVWTDGDNEGYNTKSATAM